MTTPSATSVLRTVVVPLAPGAAFAAFTERFAEIKPAEHNLLGAPSVVTVVEPGVGGGFVDRAEDGRECRWGRMLAWEPPSRLVFSWDISPAWEYEPDPARTSEVEVRFVPVADGTRVELEHRHLDRHGPGWEGFAEQLFGANGFPLWLERYAALVSG